MLVHQKNAHFSGRRYVNIFDWFKDTPPPAVTKVKRSLFSTHAPDSAKGSRFDVSAIFAGIMQAQPSGGSFALDDSGSASGIKANTMGANTISDALVMWYASQGFIGHQLCAMLSQNWLINKCCKIPGRDAIRKGFEVVSIDGDELDNETIKILNRYDRKFKLRHNLEEFIHKGRVFGIRIAFFKIESTDPDYYEKPFNIDGVTKNSYRGIVQVDPYWTAPELDQASASQPNSMNFYEPTYWIISGKRYHRSHLIIYRHAEPPDVLKPQYLYGGVPVPQQIMERVYASERTANEAPLLAQTKRTTVWLTDLERVMSDPDSALNNIATWAEFRDNHSIKLGDKEGDDIQQFDTSLADLDNVIMTQYQLVAAAANLPSTKLLGTTPKGFNSTGNYEEASYHEELESIQEHDLTPLCERHHALVLRSFATQDIEVTVQWKPLDSPTSKELAEENQLKAQTATSLFAIGAISGEDERQRITMDKHSGYAGIGTDESEDDDE
jgi:phage-related protein (TIGR01555 family)